MATILIDTLLPLGMIATAVYLSILVLFRSKQDTKVHLWAVLVILSSLFSSVIILYRPSIMYSPFLGFFSILAALGAWIVPQVAHIKEDDLREDFLETKKKIFMYSIFNSLQDMALVTNGDGMIVFMNHAAVDLLGDQVGLPCIEVLGCAAGSCGRCVVRSQGDLYPEPSMKEMVIHGREFEVAMNRIHNDAEGKSILLARDMTERKMIQKQLMLSEKMVSLGQLVAGVAHEINNPITFVSSNLEVLGICREKIAAYVDRLEKLAEEASVTGKPETVQKYRELLEFSGEQNVKDILNDLPNLIVDMEEGVSRVVKIVKDLKEFSHQGSENPQEADLNRLILQTLRIAANELKIHTINENLAEGLPPIVGLPQQLKQVFLNLFVNAAQAMRQTGPGTLTVSSSFSAGKFTVIVKDTGCGIPKEMLERIFDPFYTTKEVGEGTGLGLAVVYGIIMRHGGEINVSSTTGQGTSFTITLPRLMPSERDKILSSSRVIRTSE